MRAPARQTSNNYMLRVLIGAQRAARASSRMFCTTGASAMSPAPAALRRTLIAPRWRCLSSVATDDNKATSGDTGHDKTNKLTVAGTVARKQSSNELVLQAIELSKRYGDVCKFCCVLACQYAHRACSRSCAALHRRMISQRHQFALRRPARRGGRAVRVGGRLRRARPADE